MNLLLFVHFLLLVLNKMKDEELTKRLEGMEHNFDKLCSLLIGNIETQVNKNTCDLTVGEWADEFIRTYKENKLQKSTLIKYQGIIKNQIKPFFGDFLLRDLDTETIQKKLIKYDCPRQRQHVYAFLNEMYIKAVKLRKIDFNPCSAVELPTHQKKESKALTKAHEKKFVQSCLQDKYYFIFFIMLYAGLRRGEALALTQNDIDMKSKKINIDKSFLYNEIDKTKTVASVRQVPIFNELAEHLQQFKGAGTKRICPMGSESLRRRFQIVLKNAKLENKGYTIHSLRHTFATRCIEKNIPPKVVQKWMGHTTLNMTMNVYAHVNEDFEKNLINKIDKQTKK